MEPTYKIVRFYKEMPELSGEIICKGLTLEQAKAHCADPETSSRTCTNRAGIERTEVFGEWFDGYTKE